MTSGRWIPLAHVVRPQGRKGEVLADLLTDFPEQFQSPSLSLALPDGKRSAVSVESHWMPTGRNAGRIVLKFAGIDSISDAETLTGASVDLPHDERLALEDGNYYISDLIGCAMWDGEREVGMVEDLHFPADSAGRRLADAAAIFVVRRGDGDEVLIPFANEFIQTVDLAARRIEVRLPGGLLEMNG